MGIRNIQITGLSRKPRVIEPSANTVWPTQQVYDSGDSVHNMCDSDATQTPRPARAKRAEIEVCSCDSGNIYFEMAPAAIRPGPISRSRAVGWIGDYDRAAGPPATVTASDHTQETAQPRRGGERPMRGSRRLHDASGQAGALRRHLSEKSHKGAHSGACEARSPLVTG